MTAGTSDDAGTGTARIYLVRHGQTALNESGVLRGHLDPPLDGTGRHQARKIGLVLGARQPAVIIASPLRRAIQTAEPAAERTGLAVETDECLMDRDYGQWTGVPRQDVIDRWGSVDAAPGVEPPQAVRARAVDGLSGIARRYLSQTAVVVSHDAVNQQVLVAFDPDLGDADELPQDNGCYNTLEWHDGKWTVLSVNELPALGVTGEWPRKAAGGLVARNGLLSGRSFGDYEAASYDSSRDRGMMLSWTKTSGVICCAGQKTKFAASAGNTDGTLPGPAHSDSGS